MSVMLYAVPRLNTPVATDVVYAAFVELKEQSQLLRVKDLKFEN